MAAKGGGFNRWMQHTERCISSGSVADETALLQPDTEDADAGAPPRALKRNAHPHHESPLEGPAMVIATRPSRWARPYWPPRRVSRRCRTASPAPRTWGRRAAVARPD